MNKITIVGTINNSTLQVLRTSKVPDEIPLNIALPDGNYRIVGSIETYNTPDRKLCLYVIVDDAIKLTDPEQHINQVELTGNICKAPSLRTTPNGRHICDLLLAVEKDNYIPCIAWGKTAKQCYEQYKTSDTVCITGRLQSREYMKEGKIHTTYEVSVEKIRVDE